MKQRLTSLDGLRGLAIIFVIFTHLPLSIWYSVIPRSAHFLLDILLGTGPISVFIFFMLTGFFMGKLYPNPQFISFITRRYLRLFPAFLIMVISFTITLLFGKVSPFIALCIVVFDILAARIVWNLLDHSRLKRWVLPGWLLFQLGVALWYAFVLQRVPPAVFLQLWNPQLRTLISGLINATLTLSFGKYIGQMDGVYWALTAEMFFYLLYPVIVIPLLNLVRARISKWLNLLIYIAIFPFFMGLYLIGERILGFEIIKIHYMLYFVTGVIIGSETGFFLHILTPFKKFIVHASWFVIMFTIIFGLEFGRDIFPKSFDPYYQLIWVVPLALLLLTILDTDTLSSKFFGSPVLVFFGTYSYALFLTHSFIIGIAEKFISHDDPISAFVLTITVFALSLVLSWLIYHSFEAAYFRQRKTTATKKLNDIKVKERLFSPLRLVATFTITVFVLLYIAYKPPLAVFTIAQRFNMNQKQIENITGQPLQKKFTAKVNNLGMIQFHVRKKPISGVPNTEYVESNLAVRLRNEQGEEIAKSTYEVYQILDSSYHPFGFPVQLDSKGKEYTIEFELNKVSPTEEIQLVNTEGDFIVVYFPDKKTLFTKPIAGISWMLSKVIEPLTNPAFWLNLVYCAPFLVLLGIVGFTLLTG